jgi:hypothetical protein
MKKIDELTEQEILNLSAEEIDKMIKLRMAEEGIKFTEYPTKPEYHEVIKPTTKAYYCNLLGKKLSFTDMEELIKVLGVLSDCKTLCSIDDNYELPEGNKYFLKAKVENAGYSSDPSDAITPVTTYTYKEYVEIKDLLNENLKTKKEYEAKLKEYTTAVNDAKWVKEEIWERINEVNSKYSQLDTYMCRFKNEYLPLADDNEEIAMKFLNKAYSLDQEQQEYVLTNYNLKK